MLSATRARRGAACTAGREVKRATGKPNAPFPDNPSVVRFPLARLPRVGGALFEALTAESHSQFA